MSHLIWNDEGKMKARIEYKYPDSKDKMTTENIKRIELYPGYWSSSEETILNIVKNLIKKNAGQNRFLDAGCGEGRLIAVFENQFEEIVAIDPDQERLKVAESVTREQGLSKKITFKRMAIEDFEDNNRFDFILCSHILQHVHTDTVSIIIKKFKSLIKRDGLLCITTCHSTKDNGYFVKDLRRNSELLEVPITKEEFNSLINSKGTLPIHFFRLDEIGQLLSDNGFKIIEFRVFHLEKRLPGLENDKEIDDTANSNPDLQEKTGRDMMIAAVPIN
jgi:2-polyprenyl-3-methyl-5-hydroxy-6-metoxy-1,4-benzoquinol methylase